MAITDLKKLQSERKWFDCSQEMIRLVNENKLSSDDLKTIFSVFKEIEARFHPTTLAETVKHLVKVISPQESIDFILSAINTLNNSKINSASVTASLDLLNIHLCISKVKIGSFEEIEREIICLKRKSLSKNSYISLLYLGYIFYDSIGNIEHTQEYLLSYIKEIRDLKEEDFHMMDKLIKLSLLSKSFYDFSAITEMKEFDSCKDEDLKSLFVDFKNGDFKKLEGWENNIKDIICQIVREDLRVIIFDQVREKIYLINIINICFYSDQKFVYLDHFCSSLKIDQNYLLILILKAFGLGLIDGWIDSKQNILFYNSIISRQLSMQDISKMKSKFIIWRSRVNDVINQMGLN